MRRTLVVAAVLVGAALSAPWWVGAQQAPGTAAAPALSGAALSAQDLPDYELAPNGERLNEVPEALASYSARWYAIDDGGVHDSLIEVLTAFGSGDDAEAELSRSVVDRMQNALYTDTQDLGAQGLGDDDHAIFGRLSDEDVYSEIFRHAGVLVVLSTTDLAGAGSLDRLVALATIIDTRLTGDQ